MCLGFNLLKPPTFLSHLSFLLHPLNYLFFNFCFMVMVMCMRGARTPRVAPRLISTQCLHLTIGPHLFSLFWVGPTLLFVHSFFICYSFMGPVSLFLSQPDTTTCPSDLWARRSSNTSRLLLLYSLLMWIYWKLARGSHFLVRGALFSCWTGAGSFVVENCEFWDSKLTFWSLRF